MVGRRGAGNRLAPFTLDGTAATAWVMGGLHACTSTACGRAVDVDSARFFGATIVRTGAVLLAVVWLRIEPFASMLPRFRAAAFMVVEWEGTDKGSRSRVVSSCFSFRGDDDDVSPSRRTEFSCRAFGGQTLPFANRAGSHDGMEVYLLLRDMVSFVEEFSRINLIHEYQSRIKSTPDTTRKLVTFRTSLRA
jgi:hypothetical protein